MMKKNVFQLFIFGIVIMFVTRLSDCKKRMAREEQLINAAEKKEDIISLFALNARDIELNVQKYMQEAQEQIDAIIAIKGHERTFSNTAKAFDNGIALSNLAIAHNIYEVLSLLSPDDVIRDAAQKAVVSIEQFFVATITNKKLYDAFMAYVDGNGRTDNLSDQQRYFITETVHDFKRQGLHLPDDSLLHVAALKNELSQLCVSFELTITQDNRTITVTYYDLAGMSDDFIAGLQQTEDGLYILGTDYPTYFAVMSNCTSAPTREKMYTLFSNRGYPNNDQVLKKIIEKRDALAQLLGYPDFAHLDLSDQMVKTPEQAHRFLDDLIERAHTKTEQEIAQFTAHLPESVTLSSAGTINPWDFLYLENEYKKNHYTIDEQALADYFPTQNTINELLDIYHHFFSIEFQEVAVSGLWHDDVKALQVFNKEHILLGTLLLDLYPRPNKYSHAAHTTIIPGTYAEDGTRIPDVSVVIANFPKATAQKPSLLTRAFAETFFHEFGHALHAILGATSIASLSGTSTKRDFVELPSQMLEEWLSDKAILKKVSKHYQTGQPLPDDIIDTIIAMKNISSGYFVTRQAYLSKISLLYYGPGTNKDPYEIMKHEYTCIQPYLFFFPDNHSYASFGHLTNYAAKYYGYLWSKVFALDLFAEIKKRGLLNPVIGQKYVRDVLSKGGCQDPNELLRTFLGREPNAKAFFEEMGL